MPHYIPVSSPPDKSGNYYIRIRSKSRNSVVYSSFARFISDDGSWLIKIVDTAGNSAEKPIKGEVLAWSYTI